MLSLFSGNIIKQDKIRNRNASTLIYVFYICLQIEVIVHMLIVNQNFTSPNFLYSKKTFLLSQYMWIDCMFSSSMNGIISTTFCENGS
jgi:hypothetical protein